jgi:hypothetical protein
MVGSSAKMPYLQYWLKCRFCWRRLWGYDAVPCTQREYVSELLYKTPRRHIPVDNILHSFTLHRVLKDTAIFYEYTFVEDSGEISTPSEFLNKRRFPKVFWQGIASVLQRTIQLFWNRFMQLRSRKLEPHEEATFALNFLILLLLIYCNWVCTRWQ